MDLTNAEPSPVSGVALNEGTWFFNVSVKSPLPWRLSAISSNPSIGVGDFIAVLPAARVPVTNTPSPDTAETARAKFRFAPPAPTSTLFVFVLCPMYDAFTFCTPGVTPVIM